MSSLICTLFEGDYHLGVAGLVNSLVQSGYRGQIRAGYRGELPDWAKDSSQNEDSQSHECRNFKVGDSGCQIAFQRLETEAHFTNFKPHFLLQSLDKRPVDRVFYFDPDIVVQAPWRFFEEWADAGVALAEDVNSPLSEYHPRRVAWRRKLNEVGLHLRFRQAAYVNGGFIGIRPESRVVADQWLRVLTEIISSDGGERGWNHTTVAGGSISKDLGSFAHPFSIPDQDALNAALELCPERDLSIIGQEAMGFKPGGYIMHHALGPWKPWRRHYIKEALGGRPPAMVDKKFWKLMADGPIRPVPSKFVRQKLLTIRLAAAIGRFVRRA